MIFFMSSGLPSSPFRSRFCRLAKGALAKEGVGELVEAGDLFIRLARKLVNGQKAFLRVESEMPGVVVGEISGVVLPSRRREAGAFQYCGERRSSPQ